MALADNVLQQLILHDGGTFAVTTNSDAFAFCEKLTSGHYENFPVALLTLNRLRRRYLCTLYAFARLADDVADQMEASSDRRISILRQFSHIVQSSSISHHPVFRAVQVMQQEIHLPLSIIHRLLIAFERDSAFVQPSTWDDVRDYCQHSANPVGEAVLHIFGENNDSTRILSGNVCTALQLINFWQDLSRDVPSGRMYIPTEIMADFGLSSSGLVEDGFYAKFPSKTEQMLDVLYRRSAEIMNDGARIVSAVRQRTLKLQLSATIEGGLSILRSCRRLGLRVFHQRPSLRTIHLLPLTVRTLSRLLRR